MYFTFDTAFIDDVGQLSLFLCGTSAVNGLR
jgi:hypothetical protein